MVQIICGLEIKNHSFDKDQSVLEFLRGEGYRVAAVCSGHQTCGKCRVQILKEAPVPNEKDKEFFSPEELASGFRLSCAHGIQAGMKIKLEETGPMQSLTQFDQKDLCLPEHGGDGYGIAVDLGTTTVVAGLVSKAKGKILRLTSSLNPQSGYGADVISRIQSARQYGIEVLRDLIRLHIKRAIEDLCAQEGIQPRQVRDIAIAGNTTMLYLLQGFDPGELALAPFTVSHGDYAEYDASQFFSPGWTGRVKLFPCVAAYVGGDIVSGLYAYGEILKENQPAGFLDLGTNGEIVLISNDRVICAATAAGPAFEGAGIQAGVGGVAGAIDKVAVEADGIHCRTIGGLEPIGICGSGIIDIVSEGLRVGRIDRTGRMAGGDWHLCGGERPICFSQKDIREVQLAKAAVAAGLEVLGKHMKVEADQFETFLIAGGFGQYVDLNHAGEIGLIPQQVAETSRTIGNASFAGAVKALFDPRIQIHAEEIQAMCQYIELSADKSFNGIYIQKMGF